LPHLSRSTPRSSSEARQAAKVQVTGRLVPGGQTAPNDPVKGKVSRRKDKELALKELIKWRKHLALE
jgi:hypothetical protein